jgi:hypothetical protein
MFHSTFQKIMIKKSIAGFLALALNLAHAASPCDVWEYARLKDSTAKDLAAHACASNKVAEASRDEKYTLIGDVGGDMRRVDAVAKEEAVCRDQVKVTQSVFQQRFKKERRIEDCDAPAMQ